MDFVERSLNSLKELIKPTPPSMKELPDCGKRYIRPEGYSKLGECFWNCEWRPNPLYQNIPNTLTITTNIPTATALLPNSWVSFISTVFGFSTYPDNTILYSLITLPMIPVDTKCLRDCYPLNILQDNQDSRFEVCRISFLESIAATGVVNNDNWLTFYQCIMLLNSQPVPGSTMLGANGEIREYYSIARDFFTAASEICFLAHFSLDPSNGLDPIYSPAMIEGCDSILLCTIPEQGSPLCPIGPRKNKSDGSKNNKRSTLERISAKYKNSSKNRKKKNKKKNKRRNKSKVLNHAYLSILERQSPGSSNDSRLTGATVFPVDIIDIVNAGHHPWACSLKTS